MLSEEEQQTFNVSEYLQQNELHLQVLSRMIDGSYVRVLFPFYLLIDCGLFESYS